MFRGKEVPKVDFRDIALELRSFQHYLLNWARPEKERFVFISALRLKHTSLVGNASEATKQLFSLLV